MAESIEQLEKNIQASFGYVKKDLLMINDTISDMQEKIQHLSLNHAALLGEIETLRERMSRNSTKTEKKTETKAKKSINTKTSKKKR